MRVLIVDDDEGMAETLSDILNFKGFDVDVSSSGEQAINAIQSKNYDCVISDIKMPGMTGIELNKTLKSSHPDLPVLLMTAYAAEQSIETGINEGAITFLEKPIDLDKLLDFLALLERSHNVQIISADSEFCDWLSPALQSQGFLIATVSDPFISLDNLNPQDQLVILHVDESRKIQVIKRLRQSSSANPIILIGEDEDEMNPDFKKVIDDNGITWFKKPVDLDRFISFVKAFVLERLRQEFN